MERERERGKIFMDYVFGDGNFSYFHVVIFFEIF